MTAARGGGRITGRLGFAIGFLGILVVSAAAAPLVAAIGSPFVPYSPDRVDLPSRFLPPSSVHLFGTDELGRDLLARTIHGARVSLAVGLAVAVLSLCVGILVGSMAGFAGGVIDWAVSRATELALSFPFFFLALGVAALFEPSLGAVVATLVAVSWTSDAKVVRGEVRRLRDGDIATAARAAGASRARILFRHLLPAAIGPAVASAAFGVASAIAAESALSFLGLGVQPPQASWGSILASADDHIRRAWWIAAFPGLALFATIIACNFVGEAARDALNPEADVRGR
ncbi:MAG: ABC transporter permease [Acidobacteria bacterium]|nr:ABC transporter permease [Acidobacteriota bacterium]